MLGRPHLALLIFAWLICGCGRDNGVGLSDPGGDPSTPGPILELAAESADDEACRECHEAVDALCNKCSVVEGNPGWDNAMCVDSCNIDFGWDEEPCLRAVDGKVDECNRNCRGDHPCEGNCGGRFKEDRINECHGVKGDRDRQRQGCLDKCAGILAAISGCRGEWCGGRGSNGEHQSCSGRAFCKGPDKKCTPTPKKESNTSYCQEVGCGLVVKDDEDSCCSAECPLGQTATCDCKLSGFLGVSEKTPHCSCKNPTLPTNQTRP